MKIVNIHAAEAQLSRLVEQAAAGELIIIAKAGRPRARLVPLPPPGNPRKPGSMKGKIRIHSNFDAPLPREIAEAFGLDATR